MDAREVRLGNYVYNTKGEADIIDIDAIKYLLQYPEPYCQVKPILLTEDLLLMCEFSFDDDFGCKPSDDTSYEIYRLNGFLIGKNEKGEWYRWNENDEDKWYSGFVGKEIKYLHQLQNIYYCLQEEELPVNL